MHISTFDMLSSRSPWPPLNPFHSSSPVRWPHTPPYCFSQPTRAAYRWICCYFMACKVSSTVTSAPHFDVELWASYICQAPLLWDIIGSASSTTLDLYFIVFFFICCGLQVPLFPLRKLVIRSKLDLSWPASKTVPFSAFNPRNNIGSGRTFYGPFSSY
jgi:hypothetical protein